MDWRIRVYTLVATGKIEDALDVVFKGFDDLFCAGNFDEANATIDQLDVERMNTDLMVGVLSATLPAKNKLLARKHFVEKVRARLTEIASDRVERLMEGLT